MRRLFATTATIHFAAAADWPLCRSCENKAGACNGIVLGPGVLPVSAGGGDEGGWVGETGPPRGNCPEESSKSKNSRRPASPRLSRCDTRFLA